MSFFGILLGPLFGAVLDPRARILKHPMRKKILEIVERQPGMLAQALADSIGCNRSTLRYHVAVMQSAGILRVVSQQQRAYLFAATLSAERQQSLSILQRGRTWELARQVAQNPGQPQMELTAKLQMSRKILRKYVNRLLQVGLIQEIQDPPYVTYFPTGDLTKMVDIYPAEAVTGFRQAPPRSEVPTEGERTAEVQVVAPGIEVPR